MPNRPNIHDPVKQAPRLLTCRPGQAILTGKDKLVALKVYADYGQILVDTGHRLDLLYLYAKKQIFPGILAPKEIAVHRKEVYDAIKREERAFALPAAKALIGGGK